MDTPTDADGAVSRDWVAGMPPAFTAGHFNKSAGQELILVNTPFHSHFDCRSVIFYALGAKVSVTGAARAAEGGRSGAGSGRSRSAVTFPTWEAGVAVTQRPERTDDGVAWTPVVLSLRALVDTPTWLGALASRWKGANAGVHDIFRKLKNKKNYWPARANGMLASVAKGAAAERGRELFRAAGQCGQPAGVEVKGAAGVLGLAASCPDPLAPGGRLAIMPYALTDGKTVRGDIVAAMREIGRAMHPAVPQGWIDGAVAGVEAAWSDDAAALEYMKFLRYFSPFSGKTKERLVSRRARSLERRQCAAGRFCASCSGRAHQA
eukprot:g3594.t1